MTSPKRKPGRPATGQTPLRCFRIEPEKWEPFARTAGKGQATEIVKAFMAWYARLPGAKLPKRPELEPSSVDGDPEAAEQ